MIPCEKQRKSPKCFIMILKWIYFCSRVKIITLKTIIMAFSSKLNIKILTKHKTTFSVKTVYAYIQKHYVSFLYLSVCGDHTMLVNTAV